MKIVTVTTKIDEESLSGHERTLKVELLVGCKKGEPGIFARIFLSLVGASDVYDMVRRFTSASYQANCELQANTGEEE